MGDRSNLFIQMDKRDDGKWDGIGVYSHWYGEELFEVAQRAIDSPPAQHRVGDDAYFARIVVHRILAAIADPDSETGFGLWVTSPCDNEHPIMVVNSWTGKWWYADEATYRDSLKEE